MADKLHDYFKRNSSEWCITGFLDECKIEPFERKIDQYLRCLNTISGGMKGKRKERAETLLKNYREGSKFMSNVYGSLSFKAIRQATKPVLWHR
jgi:hypothetical protein